MNCPFCDETNINHRIFFKSKNFIAISNKYPLVEGHSLVIPRRHVESPFELTTKESEELFDVLNKATKIILKKYNLNDFNWVLNKGVIAAQRVKHLHFHILPRRKEDLGKDPRNFFIRLTEKEMKGERI